MSKEGGVQRFERFLPKEGEEFIENGISGTRRVVKGFKYSGPYAGDYTLEKVELRSEASQLDRYELTLERPFDETTRKVVFINGEISSLEGFGSNLTEGEMHLYAGTVSHSFAKSDEFIPPLESE